MPGPRAHQDVKSRDISCTVVGIDFDFLVDKPLDWSSCCMHCVSSVVM